MQYQLISTNQQLKQLRMGAKLAFDTETTHLDPRHGTVRLLSLYDGQQAVVIDLFRVDDKETLNNLLSRPLLGYNAVFDLYHLQSIGLSPSLPYCALLGATVLDGEVRTLAQRVKQYCGRELSKTLQKSNWNTAHLSEAQLEYAAADSVATWDLFHKLKPLIESHKQVRYYQQLRQMQPIMLHQFKYGIPFDGQRHSALVTEWEAEYVARRKALEEVLGCGVNPRSCKQLSEWLKDNLDDDQLTGWDKTATGQLATSRGVLAQRLDVPIAARLLAYREADKKVSCYGRKFAEKHVFEGRIYPHWRIAGARSGRFSCSSPNLQQSVARKDVRFRQCFRAPVGWKFVKADLNQAEVRAAGLLSQDTVLLAMLRQGVDIHAQTAASLGIDRATAKTCFFGLLYGQTPHGLCIILKQTAGIDVTELRAAEFQRGVLKMFPQLALRRNRWLFGPDILETASGRTFRYVFNTHRRNLKINYPIQGTIADVLIYALEQLFPHLSEVVQLSAHIHDELLLLVEESQVSTAATHLKDALFGAWHHVFGDGHGMSEDSLITLEIKDTW